MANKFDWNNISEDIIKSLGEKNNIKSFFHCATRLRVEVKDDSKVKESNLSKIALVKGVNKELEQWQIIFGPGTVNKVHDNFATYFSNENNSHKTIALTKTSTTLWNHKISFFANLILIARKLLRSFSDIFIPLIPIFIAGGLALAFNSLTGTVAKSLGTQDSIGVKSTQKFLELIGGGILGSLPAFVGYTAMKKYGGNPMLGLAIGIILVAPGLINAWSSGDAVNWTNVPVTQDQLGNKQAYALFPELPTLFSFQLIGYQAQVFPVLLIVAVAYWIEKLLKKFTPEFLAILLIPVVTIFLSVFLGFFIIGPIGRYIGFGLAFVLQKIFIYTNFPGFGLGGAILGFVYPFMVLTGLHQGLLPIEAQLITQTAATYGHSYTWITPIATVANISQGMVGLTMVLFLAKAPKQVSNAVSGSLSANLGITEPIMFGINLPIKFGMIAVAVSSAIGGYWIGATHTVANSLGSASWLGIVVQFDYVVNDQFNTYLTDNGINAMLTNVAPVFNILIAALLSTVTAIGLTILFAKTFGKKDLEEFIKRNA